MALTAPFHYSSGPAIIFLTAIIAVLAATLQAFILKCRDNSVEACRRLGLPYSSNLQDEHSHKYDGGEQEQAGNPWRVKSLWIYPLKSCKGVELQRGTVTGLGMQYDRQFSFAHLTNVQKKPKDPKEPMGPPVYGWKFLTQREVPALATVKTEVWVPDPSSPNCHPSHPNVLSGGIIVIKWPNTRSTLLKKMTRKKEYSVQIPFNPTPDQIEQSNYERSAMNIWMDTPPALKIASTEETRPGRCNRWISDVLDYLDEESRRQNPPYKAKDKEEMRPGFNFNMTKPFALFRIANQQPRQVFRNAPTKEDLGYQPTVGLQDAYPVNLQNLASVHDVASKLDPDAPHLSVKNFRTNIIITGGDAYMEDDWRRIKIGDNEYDVSCRTARCLMPNVDQASGKKAPSEPNKTLKSFRKIDEGCKNEACLGMQMVPMVQDERVVAVGDTVEVLMTGEHKYIKSSST